MYSIPTLGFSVTTNLVYCESCGYYQHVVNLPSDIPLGNYQVDLIASHPGYDPAQAGMVFFVTPSLTMTLDANPSTLSAEEHLTLTAQVYDRGVTVAGAGALAEVVTPGGAVTVPLAYDGSAYTTVFRLVDLEPNLGAEVSGGQWKIQATAEYYGGTASASATTIVLHQVYLPLVLKS